MAHRKDFDASSSKLVTFLLLAIEYKMKETEGFVAENMYLCNQYYILCGKIQSGIAWAVLSVKWTAAFVKTGKSKSLNGRKKQPQKI